MDSFTERNTTSWFGRMGNSCMGMVIGLLLFFGSFVVLFWNEGQTDFSQVAKSAIEISAESPGNTPIGKLVSSTGEISSDATLGDEYGVKSGDYIALKRVAEMFAWTQVESSKTEKNLGGSETTTTTYTYKKEWTEEPKNSSDFKKPAGHSNPVMDVKSETLKVSNAKVGSYDIDPKAVVLPSTLNPLTLNEENTEPARDFTLSDGYLFKGQGTVSEPKVGDVRLRYFVLPSKTKVTIFGSLDSATKIGPYTMKDDNQFYRLFTGDRKTAIATLKQEFTLTIWIFRLIGFVMMWIGLSLQSGLITVFLDVLPFLGNTFGFITGAASFLIALVLSIITILISSLVHHPVVLIVVIAIGGGIYYYLKKNRPH